MRNDGFFPILRDCGGGLFFFTRKPITDPLPEDCKVHGKIAAPDNPVCHACGCPVAPGETPMTTAEVIAAIKRSEDTALGLDPRIREVVNWMVTKYGGYLRALQAQGYFRVGGEFVSLSNKDNSITFFDMNHEGDDLRGNYSDIPQYKILSDVRRMLEEVAITEQKLAENEGSRNFSHDNKTTKRQFSPEEKQVMWKELKGMMQAEIAAAGKSDESGKIVVNQSDGTLNRNGGDMKKDYLDKDVRRAEMLGRRGICSRREDWQFELDILEQIHKLLLTHQEYLLRELEANDDDGNILGRSGVKGALLLALDQLEDRIAENSERQQSVRKDLEMFTDLTPSPAEEGL
jgi:hypothetical protein